MVLTTLRLDALECQGSSQAKVTAGKTERLEVILLVKDIILLVMVWLG